MPTATKTSFNCSFCGKVQGDVARLIAGPGVFICDECVGLCVNIIESEGTPIPKRNLPDVSPSLKAGGGGERNQREQPYSWTDDLSDEQLMVRMLKVAQSREQVDKSVAEFVQKLRERGVTWARIGEALGMTRQSAWERYSGEE